ncbi:MAG: RNA polymerase sigma-70 factor [Flavobacteriales bacterium]
MQNRPGEKSIRNCLFCPHFYSENQPVILALLKPPPSEDELSAAEFRALFNQFYKPIRNYIYFRCADVDMAEDLAQDVFVKLWENRGRIERKTVKAYLYTIALHLTINQVKRRQLYFRYLKERPGDRDFDTPEKLAEMEDYNRKLVGVINSLPEGGREVFLMNRLEDLTYNEIADRLGLSVKAVEKRMSKVLRIFREQLGTEI